MSDQGSPPLLGAQRRRKSRTFGLGPGLRGAARFRSRFGRARSEVQQCPATLTGIAEFTVFRACP